MFCVRTMKVQVSLLLDDLSTFVCVASCGSFNKAGELLYLSANGVKKRIEDLESQLGVRLFFRSPRGVALTQAGRCFLQDARSIIQSCHDAAARARQAARSALDVIRIGMMGTFAHQFLVSNWLDVRSALRNVKSQLTFFGTDNTDLLAMLGSVGVEIDLAVDVFDEALASRFGLSAVKISSLPLVCGVSPDSALAQKPRLAFGDLAGRRIVFLPEGRSAATDAVRAELRRRCPSAILESTAEYSPRIFNDCSQGEAVILATGDWRELYPFLRFIPCAECGCGSIPYGLYHRHDVAGQVRRCIDIIHSRSL